jgi:hypothetical protein
MEQRVFHGPVTPGDFAAALIAAFNRGNLRAQQIVHDEEVAVQIASAAAPMSGGQTALTVHLAPVTDGVMATLGQQEWLGVAASLGMTAFMALRNPLSLLTRLDDLAEDVNNLQLTSRVWALLEQTAKGMGASFEISERLRRITCLYCLTANPVGEPACIACGAPLGPNQPVACTKCGFVAEAGSRFCPNCGEPLPS